MSAEDLDHWAGLLADKYGIAWPIADEEDDDDTSN